MVASHSTSPNAYETARAYLSDLVSYTVSLKNRRDFEYAYGREIIEHPTLGPVTAEAQVFDAAVIFILVVPALRAAVSTESFAQAARWIRDLAVNY